MVGPSQPYKGKSIVGTALTLQFMPQRPDCHEGEYADPKRSASPVLYEVEETTWSSSMRAAT